MPLSSLFIIFTFLKIVRKSTLAFTRQVVPVTFYIILKMITHSPFFNIPVFFILKVLFVYVSYAIIIINVFHDVNLALSRVRSIDSIETWKQMKVFRKFKERKRNQV